MATKNTKVIEYEGTEYSIPVSFDKQYPELIQLILKTWSMDNKERQYWFDISNEMTDEQIDRLFDILESERIKLEKLEEKYKEEMKFLGQNIS